VTRRMERVAEEIRERVAGIISELKDPRIGFVTVTRVEVADDLGMARVFVGVLGDDAQRKETLGALKRSGGFVRHQLAQRTRMRSVPEVLFEYDKGLDAADRVARILEEIGETETKPEE
jgi:ribosome-binding factor A